MGSDDDDARRIHRQGRRDAAQRSQYPMHDWSPPMSRTKSFALRLAGLAAFALVLAAPFRWQ